MTKTACPIPECGYSANMAEFDEALRRPLDLNTTRSHESKDAHRDMDDFDEDEELARLRRAVKETETVSPEENPELYRFIVEAFGNIDEGLRRLGPLPKAWRGAALEDLEEDDETQVDLNAEELSTVMRKKLRGVRIPDDPTPAEGSWEQLNDTCRATFGFDAVSIALGVFCERLTDPEEDPDEHPDLKPHNDRTARLSDILGSNGDSNSRDAAAVILRALDDPAVDTVELANRSGGIRISAGFYTKR